MIENFKCRRVVDRRFRAVARRHLSGQIGRLRNSTSPSPGSGFRQCSPEPPPISQFPKNISDHPLAQADNANCPIWQVSIWRAVSVPISRFHRFLVCPRFRRGITADTALRLARYFGTPPDFWMSLQASYDVKKAREAAGLEIEKAVSPRGKSRSVTGCGNRPSMPTARSGRCRSGAKGETRTLTGVARWNLNPVRLPISPLSRWEHPRVNGGIGQ